MILFLFQLPVTSQILPILEVASLYITAQTDFSFTRLQP